jgi:hypothetical protein
MLPLPTKRLAATDRTYKETTATSNEASWATRPPLAGGRGHAGQRHNRSRRRAERPVGRTAPGTNSSNRLCTCLQGAKLARSIAASAGRTPQRGARAAQQVRRRAGGRGRSRGRVLTSTVGTEAGSACVRAASAARMCSWGRCRASLAPGGAQPGAPSQPDQLCIRTP